MNSTYQSGDDFGPFFENISMLDDDRLLRARLGRENLLADGRALFLGLVEPSAEAATVPETEHKGAQDVSKHKHALVSVQPTWRRAPACNVYS